MENETGIKKTYLEHKRANGLDPSRFQDRKKLQLFLAEHIEELWREHHGFSRGGLYDNKMTGAALGFAYYDCRSTAFCSKWCYGLPLSGPYEYNMLRLGVMMSEGLKTHDERLLKPLRQQIRGMTHLKVGHWGDATPEQVPVLLQLAEDNPKTTFWWYSRRREVVLLVNQSGRRNMKAYLSLDPDTKYPKRADYPFGFTYVFGDGRCHPHHGEILADDRLVAVFSLKRGKTAEPPIDHPMMCPAKAAGSEADDGVCLTCAGRCNAAPLSELPPPPQPRQQGEMDV